MDFAIMFLQPHCLLWALEGRFHRVALMTTTEVVEQSTAGGVWLFLLLVLCNAACPPPPPSSTFTTNHHHHPNKPQLSSPLNQSRCLFNYWEQRGSLTNSFSQPLIAPSLAFLSSSLCHSLRLDFSLCLPLLSSPSLFPPHLPCSLVSACSICLTVHFHFYGLQSLFQHPLTLTTLHPFLLLPPAAPPFTARQCHRHRLWAFPHLAPGLPLFT